MLRVIILGLEIVVEVDDCMALNRRVVDQIFYDLRAMLLIGMRDSLCSQAVKDIVGGLGIRRSLVQLGRRGPALRLRRGRDLRCWLLRRGSGSDFRLIRHW
jgi:hypothetical protein